MIMYVYLGESASGFQSRAVPGTIPGTVAHCFFFIPESACQGSLSVEEPELLNCIPAPHRDARVRSLRWEPCGGRRIARAGHLTLPRSSGLASSQHAGSQGLSLRRLIDLTAAATCNVQVLQPPATGTSSAIAAIVGPRRSSFGHGK